MSGIYHHHGKRGDLDLYYEDDTIAVDVTEHKTWGTDLRPRSCEMFIHVDDVDDLIAALTAMRTTIIQRTKEKQ